MYPPYGSYTNCGFQERYQPIEELNSNTNTSFPIARIATDSNDPTMYNNNPANQSSFSNRINKQNNLNDQPLTSDVSPPTTYNKEISSNSLPQVSNASFNATQHPMIGRPVTAQFQPPGPQVQFQPFYQSPPLMPSSSCSQGGPPDSSSQDQSKTISSNSQLFSPHVAPTLRLESQIQSPHSQSAQITMQSQFSPQVANQQYFNHSQPPMPGYPTENLNAASQLCAATITNKVPAPPIQPAYGQLRSDEQSPSLSQPLTTQRPRVAAQAISNQQQQFGGYPNRQFQDRTPGTALTAEEWNALNCPVNLLSDSNFLPSDGPEIPRQPTLANSVNCHPDFIRPTLTAVPVSSSLQSKCRLPLGLLVHPFRDAKDLPVIQTSTIVRCRSCRVYINPFVKFFDNGRRWRCPVCTLSNAVPDDFFFDPASQTYGDPSRRPEVRSATVEFIAPSEYMLRPPQAATYVFCLEVSRIAVTTGYLDLICDLLVDQINKLPGDSRRQIALLTYDSGVHFYVLTGKKMQMVISQDLSEVFLPELDGMVNRISDCIEPISNLLKQIPGEFAQTQQTSNCLGFVLQTALKLIGGTGGRVTVFNISIPSIGPGALACRETREDLTVPEAEHLRPATDFYRNLALEFAAAQISVDLFVLNSKYCDLATLSGVARFSGGCVHHYPGFHYPPGGGSLQVRPTTAGEPGTKAAAATSGTCDFVEVENLRRDFSRYLTRKIGFEAVLRVRCTRGLSVQNFYGNFFLRSVDLLALPVVNPDAGYAMQLEITENLDAFSTVVLQAALLYTSAFGDRRIRVHTLCLPVTDSPEAVFNSADAVTVACLVTKLAVERTISSSLRNAREALTTVMGDILEAYQNKRNAGASRAAHLSALCPASLRLLPAYICGALRFRAFRNHTATSLDARSAALELLLGSSLNRVLPLIYPRMHMVNSFVMPSSVCGADSTLAQKAALLSLDKARSSSTSSSASSSASPSASPSASLPPAIPCLPLTGKSLTRDGVILLDTGDLLILLVGYGLSESDLTSLIGYSSIEELTVENSVTKLGPLSPGEREPLPRKYLESLIKSIRQERSLGTSLILIRHDVAEPLKSCFINALVEDRTPTAPSYTEYVQMILNNQS